MILILLVVLFFLIWRVKFVAEALWGKDKNYLDEMRMACGFIVPVLLFICFLIFVCRACDVGMLNGRIDYYHWKTFTKAPLPDTDRTSEDFSIAVEKLNADILLTQRWKDSILVGWLDVVPLRRKDLIKQEVQK